MAGCITPLLNHSAASAEMLRRLSPSAPEQLTSTWKADPLDEYAVPLFNDGFPPYISNKTGAFWSKGDAELAKSFAQIIADQTGESISNKRPVRVKEQTPEGRTLYSLSFNVWQEVRPQAE